jgi:hypothetical protein
VRYAVEASIGVWRSLVARFVRDEEVVGSNPATPTRVAKGQGFDPFVGSEPFRFQLQPERRDQIGECRGVDQAGREFDRQRVDHVA